MSHRLSLKQAQRKLGSAAALFADDVIAALEEWMKAADDLRGHAQYACTEATRQLVQAALEQVPRNKLQHSQGGKQHDQVYRVWVEKHLPGISTAMLDCARRQVDIRNKRISILQSLVKTSQQQDRCQLQPRLDAERHAFVMVMTQWLVLCIILPVSAVCISMARMGNINGSQARSQRAGGLSLDHYDRNELAVLFTQATSARRQLLAETQQAQDGLIEMGLPVDVAPPRHVYSYRSVLCVILHTDMLWLSMSAQVLPSCLWAVTLFNTMLGPQLGQWPSLTPLAKAHGRADLLCLLTHPEFFSVLKERCSHAFVGRTLHWFDMGVEHLRAAGVNKTTQKELLSMMEDAASYDAGCKASGSSTGKLPGDSPALRGDSTTGNCQQGDSTATQGACAGDAAVDAAACEGVGDNDLNSMDVLLHMMYGSTV